jgi:hypothetical protein
VLLSSVSIEIPFESRLIVILSPDIVNSHRSYCEQSMLLGVSWVKVRHKNAPTKTLSMIKICASLAFVNFCAGINTNILVTNFKLFK